MLLSPDFSHILLNDIQEQVLLAREKFCETTGMTNEFIVVISSSQDVVVAIKYL